MLKNAAIALLLITAAVGSSTMVVQAQSAGEIEVRITAQRLQDERTEFALQQREGDAWSDRIAPRARFLPAEPPLDRWLVSTPVTIAASAMLQTESGGETAGEIEVRITAQRLQDGRTEFALQQREGDGWSDRIAPRARFLPAEPPLDRWLVSTPVTIAAPTPTPEPTATPTPTQSASDRAALVALYHGTGGANWDANTNWLSDRPIGEWSGVTTDSNGRVMTLHLNNNQLTGEIPPELGGLSNLTWLVLHDNELTGEIPPELGALSNLTNLSLYDNQLTGEIPSELGSLSNLTELVLHTNQLTGEIPSELGRLSNLTWLGLGDNQLTGEIPPELGGLSNLTWLSLLTNQLTGEIPPELGGLSNLTELVLHTNQLTGEIPPELGRLSNLEVLDFGYNQLTGEIPPELGGLSNLTRLWLSGNQLTGCIPEGLRDIAENDLASLNLPDCGAATPGPTQSGSDRAALVAFYHSTDGANWDANTNWLSDRPIGEWHGVTTDSNGRVMTLHLNNNQLTGEIPPELGGLSNLTWLVLHDNELTGEIPPELGALSNLTNLSLYDNQLTGEIPSELGSLSNLTELVLHTNQLTGEIPPELGRLPNLTWLSLDYNQLTGEIPPELGRLSNLTLLRLGDNQLTGCIPEGLRDIADNDLVNLNLPDCDAATPGPTATPTPETPTPTPTPETADGLCRVGLIVSPGESCTYPGTSTEFTVDSSGTGRFLFFTSTTGIDARNSTLSGVSYNFKASKQDDGNWIIEAAGAS